MNKVKHPHGSCELCPYSLLDFQTPAIRHLARHRLLERRIVCHRLTPAGSVCLAHGGIYRRSNGQSEVEELSSFESRFAVHMVRQTLWFWWELKLTIFAGVRMSESCARLRLFI